MSLSKSLVALGEWIERHFPEKITAAEIERRILTIEAQVGVTGGVLEDYKAYIEALRQRVDALEKKSETLNSDINKAKVMLLTQRQTGR